MAEWAELANNATVAENATAEWGGAAPRNASLQSAVTANDSFVAEEWSGAVQLAGSPQAVAPSSLPPDDNATLVASPNAMLLARDAAALPPPPSSIKSSEPAEPPAVADTASSTATAMLEEDEVVLQAEEEAPLDEVPAATPRRHHHHHHPQHHDVEGQRPRHRHQQQPRVRPMLPQLEREERAPAHLARGTDVWHAHHRRAAASLGVGEVLSKEDFMRELQQLVSSLEANKEPTSNQGKIVATRFELPVPTDLEVTEVCYERQPKHSRIWFTTKDWSPSGRNYMTDHTSEPDVRYHIKGFKDREIKKNMWDPAKNPDGTWCKCAPALKDKDTTVSGIYAITMLFCQANGKLSFANTCRDYAGYIFNTVTGQDPPELKAGSLGCHGGDSTDVYLAEEVVIPGVRSKEQAKAYVMEFNKKYKGTEIALLKVKDVQHLEVSKQSPVRQNVDLHDAACPVATDVPDA